MKGLNLAGIFCTVFLSTSLFAGDQLGGVYSLKLFFGDSAPFTDELTINVDDQGAVTGRLHVPDDFDADIEDVAVSLNGVLKFHVSLPEKYREAFPVGLNYQINFRRYEHNFSQLTDFSHFSGFVTSQATHPEKYVGSVVGFRK